MVHEEMLTHAAHCLQKQSHTHLVSSVPMSRALEIPHGDIAKLAPENTYIMTVSTIRSFVNFFHTGYG